MKTLLTRLAIVCLLLSLISCNLSASASPTPDVLATELNGTLQALASSTAAPTSAPTLTSSPVPTTIPSATPAPTSNLPSATRINFLSGATEGVVESTIQANQTLYYVAGAAKDQVMIVMLSTPDNSATLSVFAANGAVLLPASSHTSNWQGVLPSTQDYYFRIDGGSSAQNFNLNLIIAARVQFQTGQDTITYKGKTVGGFAVSYVAYAFKGQKLDVTVNTDPNDAALTIYGFSDGQLYARAQNGVTDFSMVLLSTQDYMIEVVPQGGRVIDYTITIKIK